MDFTGSIGTLMNLVTELADRIEDRKFASEMREIHALVSSIQSMHSSLVSENLDLKNEISDIKNKHSQEVNALNLQMSELISKNRELQLTIAELDPPDVFSSDVHER